MCPAPRLRHATQTARRAALGTLLVTASLVLAPRCAAAVTLSPESVAVSPDHKTLYVGDKTARRITIVDTAEERVVATLPVPEPVNGIAVSPDGAAIYVAGASHNGKLHIIDLAARTISASIPVGHTPIAPAAHPNGRIVFVCNRFTNDVSVIDIAARKEITRIPAVNDPYAAAITPDGAILVVANHLPAGPADRDEVFATVTLIDANTHQALANADLPNGSHSCRGVAISPDGQYAYITGLLSRFQVPTTQLARGWINTNAFSIIDIGQRQWIGSILLDDVDRGAANPWGIACSADGKRLCVAIAGTGEISVVDRQAIHRQLAEESADAVMNDLSFLARLDRRRIRSAGDGTRAITLAGDRLYAADYFAGALTRLELDAAAPRPVAIPLGPQPEMDQVRRGEYWFHSAEACFQSWLSCISCHPDARDDVLNWDLLNDGMGNPKNTKSLIFSHQTPPAMITGIRASAEVAVRAGLRHIQFAARPEADAEAIDAYLKSLQPLPSPHLVDGELSPTAREGRELFERAQCGRCHSGPYYTNLKAYDVGTGTGMEAGRTFDTPTLREVWRTAPYLYDGRAATMMDVLTTHNTDDRHGVTRALSQPELEALAEYVLSL